MLGPLFILYTYAKFNIFSVLGPLFILYTSAKFDSFSVLGPLFILTSEKFDSLGSDCLPVLMTPNNLPSSRAPSHRPTEAASVSRELAWVHEWWVQSLELLSSNKTKALIVIQIHTIN